MRGGDRGLTVVVVVTHHDLLDLAVLAHLAPEILVEGVEVVLQLARVHLVLGVVGWVLVEVGEQDRLRVRGLDVFSGAAVAVAAGAYFVVEGAVDLGDMLVSGVLEMLFWWVFANLVLLCTEDGGEVVRHGEGGREAGRRA